MSLWRGLTGSSRIFWQNAADALDYVFVTHGDEDHISGIRELLEGQELGIRIRNLVLPPEEYHDESIRALARTARGKQYPDSGDGTGRFDSRP